MNIKEQMVSVPVNQITMVKPEGVTTIGIAWDGVNPACIVINDGHFIGPECESANRVAIACAALRKILDVMGDTTAQQDPNDDVRVFGPWACFQHQGEPTGWLDPATGDFLTAEGRATTLSMGHGDRLARYTVPLYTHADTGEVERLRREAKNDAVAYRAAIEKQEEIRAERDQLQVDLTERDERIDQLRSGYLFETGPYQVELTEDQWSAALGVFENYNMGDDKHFVFLEEQGRGVISEMLIELGLAPVVD